jgi:hypothetical protein
VGNDAIANRDPFGLELGVSSGAGLGPYGGLSGGWNHNPSAEWAGLIGWGTTQILDAIDLMIPGPIQPTQTAASLYQSILIGKIIDIASKGFSESIKNRVLADAGGEPIDLGPCSPPARSVYSHSEVFSINKKMKDDIVGLKWSYNGGLLKRKIAQMEYSALSAELVGTVDFWKTCCCVETSRGKMWRWQLRVGYLADVNMKIGFNWKFKMYLSAVPPIQREIVVYSEDGVYSSAVSLESMNGNIIKFKTSCKLQNE